MRPSSSHLALPGGRVEPFLPDLVSFAPPPLRCPVPRGHLSRTADPTVIQRPPVNEPIRCRIFAWLGSLVLALNEYRSFNSERPGPHANRRGAGSAVTSPAPASPGAVQTGAGGKRHVSSADAGLRPTRGVVRPVCLCRRPGIGTECCVWIIEKRHIPCPYGAVRVGCGEQLAVLAERHPVHPPLATARKGEPTACRVARVPQPHGSAVGRRRG